LDLDLSDLVVSDSVDVVASDLPASDLLVSDLPAPLLLALSDFFDLDDFVCSSGFSGWLGGLVVPGGTIASGFASVFVLFE